MIVFYDPTPISTNPDCYRITHTVTGETDDLTAGATNWISAPTADLTSLDAWVVEAGSLVLASIGPYRRAAIAKINARAGEVRLTFITDIPGQQMLYAAKEQEATAYLAASPEPADLSAFPLMAAEVGPGLTAPTALGLAQLWAAMAAQWRGMAAMIENARLSTIYGVEAAPDRAAIEQIVAGFMAAMSQPPFQP